MKSLSKKGGILYVSENILRRNTFFSKVTKIWICYLLPKQSFLVGIVVPDEETLPAFAENLGVKGSFEDLCKNSVSGHTFYFIKN